MVPLSWGAQLSLMLASFELRLEYFGLFDTEGALDEGPRLSLLVYFPWILFDSPASPWPGLQVHSGSLTSLKSAVFVSL